MNKTATFISLLIILGILCVSGCKKDEKTGAGKKEGASRTQPTEPAPVPEGTPPY
ncbi:MAG: hypothetical protein HZA16_06320 [Nitrospirae bacterium]|nr:hypothetical protein [Nitrospirota bacterium]